MASRFRAAHPPTYEQAEAARRARGPQRNGHRAVSCLLQDRPFPPFQLECAHEAEIRFLREETNCSAAFPPAHDSTCPSTANGKKPKPPAPDPPRKRPSRRPSEQAQAQATRESRPRLLYCLHRKGKTRRREGRKGTQDQPMARRRYLSNSARSSPPDPTILEPRSDTTQVPTRNREREPQRLPKPYIDLR